MVFRELRERGVTRLSGTAPGLLSAYPIGAIYFSDRLVDPAVLFGGTWSRFAQGRVLVGLDEGQTEFDTVLETGGEKAHTLTTAEIPGHTHGTGTLATTTTGSAHTHGAGSLTVSQRASTGSAAGAAIGNQTISGNAQVAGDTNTTGSGHTHNVTGDTGGVNGANGGAHNILQPYITVYMWRRTA